MEDQSIVVIEPEDLELVVGGSFRPAIRPSCAESTEALIGTALGALLGPVGALLGNALGEAICERGVRSGSGGGLCDTLEAGTGLCSLNGV